MSVTRITTIHCDRCSAWTDGGLDPTATAARIRRMAKRRGWQVALSGGTDLCPNCPDAPSDKERTPE